MVSVYGIEVGNDKLAGNAKWLMHAQVALCVLGLLGGISSLIRYFTTTSTISDWQKRSGESDLITSPMMDASAVLNALIAVLIPLLLILLVRNAIRHNKHDIFTGICIFEGVCSVCAIIGVINAALTIPLYLYMRQQVHQYDCSASADVADCKAAKDPSESLLTLGIVFVAVQLVIGICEVAACVTGSTQASFASKALQQGHVFTDAPRVPTVTAVTMGQPVSSPTGPEKVIDGVGGISGSSHQNQVVVGVPV